RPPKKSQNVLAELWPWPLLNDRHGACGSDSISSLQAKSSIISVLMDMSNNMKLIIRIVRGSNSVRLPFS
ncbi:hypothetical protein JMJ77_0005285, partial [Colletotrichum scovillei]